jgi:hypothetical protein
VLKITNGASLNDATIIITAYYSAIISIIKPNDQRISDVHIRPNIS